MTVLEGAPFRAYVRNIGFVEAQPTLAIEVPRDEWRAFVKQHVVNTLDESDGRRVLEAIAPTLDTMDRFAMDTWIHGQRGCGCLVGEHLIAQGAFTRREGSVMMTVTQHLYSLYDADLAGRLTDLGGSINGAVWNWLERRGVLWRGRLATHVDHGVVDWNARDEAGDLIEDQDDPAWRWWGDGIILRIA